MLHSQEGSEIKLAVQFFTARVPHIYDTWA